MIQIIPAIDIIEGKCVRLTQGDFNTKKTYYDDPLEVALRFEAHGLKRLHLVDLDGAKKGEVINYKVIEKIASKTDFFIDFGGGIRSEKDIQIALECGARQITLGSIAVREKEKSFEWLMTYGADTLILGADVKQEKIALHGWQEQSEVYIYDFLNEYRSRGFHYVICTDIAKDGMLQGPAFELYHRIVSEVEGIKLIASGGVCSLHDIDKLQEQGLYAVIIGKALYEGQIKLNDLEKFLC